MREALDVAHDGGDSEDLHRAYVEPRQTPSASTACSPSRRRSMLEGLDARRARGFASAFGDQMVANAVEALFLNGRWAEALERLPDGRAAALA